MKKEVTIDSTEIQKVIRNYHKLLYDSKMDNLEKMNNFRNVQWDES